MLSIGKRKEVEFAKFFEKVQEATKEQDIKEHWDFNVRYDVKMIKRKKRNEGFDENIHWVELRNVNGDKGWLYGEADYFSFEVLDYWIVVSKNNLTKFISEKCASKKWSNKPELYKLYQRNGRKDIITMVKTIDLMYICSEILKK
ncbi:MAG: hypothetical protein ACO393_04085 [Methylophilaceae bacterium]